MVQQYLVERPVNIVQAIRSVDTIQSQTICCNQIRAKITGAPINNNGRATLIRIHRRRRFRQFYDDSLREQDLGLLQ